MRTLPSTITGDALGTIDARTWEEATAPYAERVLDVLERVAPGVRARIVGQRVYGPHDLEAHNPNLVGGDSVAGSHHLDQNFLFRPFVGASTYAMPVRHLSLVGAGDVAGRGQPRHERLPRCRRPDVDRASPFHRPRRRGRRRHRRRAQTPPRAGVMVGW